MSIIGALFDIAVAAGPLLAGAYGSKKIVDILNEKDTITVEKMELIDGRTEKEWYELLKSIGCEATEHLSTGPLDGLERNDSLAWNPKKLTGPYYWDKLQEEWYPWRNFPKTITQQSTGVVVHYSKPDDKSIMTITMSRNGFEVSTEILAEKATFSSLSTMARDALYEKIIAHEKVVAAEAAKMRKERMAVQLKEKEAAKLKAEQDWLRKALEKQARLPEPMPKKKTKEVSIQEVLDMLDKQRARDREILDRARRGNTNRKTVNNWGQYTDERYPKYARELDW